VGWKKLISIFITIQNWSQHARYPTMRNAESKKDTRRMRMGSVKEMAGMWMCYLPISVFKANPFSLLQQE